MTTHKLTKEELDSIVIAEFDKEQAENMHSDDLLYLLKRKLDEVPASESLQLLGSMMNHTVEKLDTLAPILHLGELIDIDLSSEPAATAIRSIAETLEELVGFIQVVIDRFGVQE